MDPERISGRENIEKFFQERNLIYLKKSRIEWLPLKKLKLHKSPYYKANKNEFTELDKKYGSYLSNSHIAPVYIEKINDKVGYGLFAAEPLKMGDFLGEYTGVVKITEEITESFEDGSWETDFSWDYPDEVKGAVLEINGRLEGNELRFVNHGSDCNLMVEHTIHEGHWVIFFIAGRDIQAGEQLLVSYGDDYWSDGFREFSELEDKS